MHRSLPSARPRRPPAISVFFMTILDLRCRGVCVGAARCFVAQDATSGVSWMHFVTQPLPLVSTRARYAYNGRSPSREARISRNGAGSFDYGPRGACDGDKRLPSQAAQVLPIVSDPGMSGACPTAIDSSMRIYQRHNVEYARTCRRSEADVFTGSTAARPVRYRPRSLRQQAKLLTYIRRSPV